MSYDTTQFLTDLFPSLPRHSTVPQFTQGCYFILGLKPQAAPRPVAVYDAQGAAATAFDLSQRGYNAYMAMPSYIDPAVGRKGINVHRVKAFWADMDVGKDTCRYRTREEALQALLDFRRLTGLRPTYVVSSGKGFHVYWMLTQPVDPPTWRVMARMFHTLCTAAKLDVDSSRAEDITSVLRVPGTLHQSSGNTVEILFKATPYTPEQFVRHILAIMPEAYNPTPQPVQPANPGMVVSDRMLQLAGMGAQEPTADPFKIARNCPQIASMGHAEYNQWFLSISVLKSCKDGLTAAHELSKLSEEKYDYAGVERAFATATPSAPARCVKFAENNSALCAQCKYRGTITSPIELSRKAVEVEVLPAEPAQPVESMNQHVQVGTEVIAFNGHGYEVTEFGIYRVSAVLNENTGEYEERRIQISDVPLYYLRSELYMNEEGMPERAHIFKAVYPPHNHATEVRYVIADCATTNGIKTWMHQHNIFQHSAGASVKMFEDFMNSYLAQVMNSGTAKTVPVRDRFGWSSYPMTDGSSARCFVIGSRAVTAEQLKPVRIHEKTQELANRVFTYRGSLEEWKNIPKLYRILDQKEGQFAMCLGFAAPLMKFVMSEARNGLFSLYGMSGRGKTETLRNVASIWGNPVESFFDRRASVTARCLKLAKWNNIPAAMDEVTDVSDADMFNLAYTLINGADKEKAASAGDALLKQGNWATVTLTTANRSFKEAVSRKAGDTDATLLRIVEMECDFKPVNEPTFRALVNHIMSVCRNNYGLAGQEFIYQLLRRDDRLDGLASVISHWVETHGFQQEERYMSFLIGVALQAGRWAVEFGLLDYDMDALEKWVLDTLVPYNRRSTRALVHDPKDSLVDFLMSNQLNTLVVDAHRRVPSIHGKAETKDTAIADKFIRYLPPRDCTIRVEQKDHTLYILKSALRDWCMKQSISVNGLVVDLRNIGIFLTDESLDVWRGIPWHRSPTSRCWRIDGSSMERLGYSFDDLVDARKEEV